MKLRKSAQEKEMNINVQLCLSKNVELDFYKNSASNLHNLCR